MNMAIAAIELISVARGVITADAMLKAGDVTLFQSCPICPGKYFIVIGGEVAAVKESLDAGLKIGLEAVTGSMILPNCHPDVFSALASATEVGRVRAIGVVETMSAPSALEAADAAAKAANVTLVQIRLGQGMGAKAFFSFIGEVADVKSSAKAAEEVVSSLGLLVDISVISGPHPDLPAVVI
jgi:microcompartment protein CcmL/EutN